MKRLLVVEDDPDIREYIVQIAEEEGYTCQQAEDGADAFFYLRTFLADVILLDLRMPNMNGIDFMKRMNLERKEHAPKMVVLSGYTTELAPEEEALAEAVLTKPLKEDKLKALLKEYYDEGNTTSAEQKFALIADDSQTYRIALKQFLLRKGVKVYEASNGAEALMVLASYDIDFVICDNQMPEMSGFEFASLASEKYPDLSIYMVSSLLTDFNEAKERGVTACIQKPLTDEQLEILIQQ